MSRLFLSYSRADRPAAERLYVDLRAAGHKPWIDIHDLPPGADWRHHIENEIERCRFFLALLSRHTVGRRGYVQAELRKGLEVLELYPSNKRYLIPVRLEECFPKDSRLASLHWVDLYPSYSDGLPKLVKYLGRTQRRTREFRSYALHGIEIPRDIAVWSDETISEWVDRELWPVLIDRARKSYEYVPDADYTTTLVDYARQLLIATAKQHGFHDAYERAAKRSQAE